MSKHEKQQDQGKQDPEKTDKPRWQDPGDDDFGLRYEAPENILNKMLRRDE